MSVQDGLILSPGAGKQVWVAGMGARFMIGGDRTGGRFALVEHPLKPRTLAAPIHTHSREDEYSFILEGEVGVQIGDQEFVGTVGTLVFRPRGVPHTFWNASEQPARLLELISPAGFEDYFAEIADVMANPKEGLAMLPTIAEKYGLSLDLSSISGLRAKHGLR